MNVKGRRIIFHVEYLKITLDNILFDKKKICYTINIGGSSYSSRGSNEPPKLGQKKILYIIF